MSTPTSVLFCCDHNAVRSPMAEGIMKSLNGTRIFVQSAGVEHDAEIDGFAIAVCEEIGIRLQRHRSRSFQEMEALGDKIDGYDLIVALTPASHALARDYMRHHAVEVEYWPIMDPSVRGEGRAEKLAHYRAVRDEIKDRIAARFGTGV